MRLAGQAQYRRSRLTSNVRPHKTQHRDMGHSVTTLVGPRETLEEFAREQNVHSPVRTGAGYWLLPLPEETLDKIVGLPVGDSVPGFAYLLPKLLLKVRAASRRSWIVYAETEYFGGTGGQGAAAFKDGAAVLEPKAAEWDCINEALAAVGVAVLPPARDEFETVGLHEQRCTDDWLPDAASEA
jgi:hypothetical protein